MIRFIGKRLLMIPLMLILITAIIFSLINVVKVNPALLILGADAGQEAIDELNEEMGYNDPLVIRYMSYLANAVRGDLGSSYFTRTPVFSEVMTRLPNTLKLTLGSIAISILFGLPLGIICAVKQYSVVDNILSVLAMFVAAVPNFWLALMLLLVFSLNLGWLPATGISQGWKSWVLPIVTACIPNIATFMRFTRSSMLETIRQDYVVTARAKGNPERAVIFRHSFRNSLMPIITVTGLFTGTMMASCVVVERVFSIPGLGSLILNSVKQKDVPMVMGAMVVFAIIFMVITLIIDVLYGFADPRIKALYTQRVRCGKKTSGVAKT